VFDHEFSVESLAVFPDAKQFVSVGGSKVSIWDIRKNQSTHNLLNNLKTVTSVKVIQDGKRIVTGSLDQQMKIYDVENEFQVAHQIKFPAGIMSFDFTNDLSHLIVGMK
jgi:U3 small nucleolar RNA-associated protein 15